MRPYRARPSAETALNAQLTMSLDQRDDFDVVGDRTFHAGALEHRRDLLNVCGGVGDDWRRRE